MYLQLKSFYNNNNNNNLFSFTVTTISRSICVGTPNNYVFDFFDFFFVFFFGTKSALLVCIFFHLVHSIL